MRAPAIFISLILFAVTASAQTSAERAAYTKVGKARGHARRIDTQPAIDAFTTQATRYLQAYPNGANRDTVLLWLGDLLKQSDPRRALSYYRDSELPEARVREVKLAFRFGPPPRLQTESWVGAPTDPTKPDGRVTFICFVSVRHPQTRILLGQVRALHERLGPAGLRIIGVASVVDEHKEQTPAYVREWVRKRRFPFPFAIDRQRNRSNSVSLDLYQGNLVPWGVFLDRYGRMVWIGPLEVERNSIRRCEAKLQALLQDPNYAQLVESALGGNESAIKKLSSIKTTESVGALYRVRAGGAPKRVRPLLDESLHEVLPRGFGLEDAKRWEEQKQHYRFSVEQDRMVRKLTNGERPTSRGR